MNKRLGYCESITDKHGSFLRMWINKFGKPMNQKAIEIYP